MVPLVGTRLLVWSVRKGKTIVSLRCCETWTSTLVYIMWVPALNVDVLNAEKAYLSSIGQDATLRNVANPPQCSEGRFKCNASSMSFGSQKGLSIHEGHAHPVVRNIKRRGATDSPPTGNK